MCMCLYPSEPSEATYTTMVIIFLYYFHVELLLQEESTASVTDLQNQDKAVLKRLFPDITVNEKMVGSKPNLCKFHFQKFKDAFQLILKNVLYHNLCSIVLYLILQVHNDWMSSFEKEAVSRLSSVSSQQEEVLIYSFIEVYLQCFFTVTSMMHTFNAA